MSMWRAVNCLNLKSDCAAAPQAFPAKKETSFDVSVCRQSHVMPPGKTWLFFLHSVIPYIFQFFGGWLLVYRASNLSFSGSLPTFSDSYMHRSARLSSPSGLSRIAVCIGIHDSLSLSQRAALSFAFFVDKVPSFPVCCGYLPPFPYMAPKHVW